MIKYRDDTEARKIEALQYQMAQTQQQHKTKMAKRAAKKSGKGQIDEVQKIILGHDASAKDKKLKELVKKNKVLTVQLEKERRLRVKIESQLEMVKKETRQSLGVLQAKHKKRLQLEERKKLINSGKKDQIKYVIPPKNPKNV